MPSEDRHLALDELAYLRKERVSDHKDPGLPYVGLEHLAQGEPFLVGTARSGASVSTNCVFESGDILFGKLRPRLRKSLQVDFAGYCSTDILVLRPREEFHPSFVAKVFQGDTVFQAAVQTSVGTRMPRTSWEDLKKLSVFVPPPESQRRIAEILDAADEAIRQTERVIAKLRQVKKGLLHDLLTRGVDAEGKLRDPKAHPEQFKHSPLGKIPRDWTTARLGTCLKVLYRYPSYYGIEYQESGIAEVRGELIRYDGTLASQPEAFRYISSETARQFPKVRVVPGDFVMSVRGTLGKVGIVPPWLEGAVITANLIRMQFYDDRILSAWMRHYLLSRHFQERLDAKSSGTTIRTIQTDAIESIFVALPSQAEQRRVAAVLDAHDERIRAEQAALEKLRQVKRGLMDDLLTGRVRV